MTSFERVKNYKIYETVIQQLKQKVSENELNPGDLLPPERTLANLMGVSRASIREALKVLQFIGFIESRPGDGTFISYLHPDILIEKLNSVTASKKEDLLLDLLELREVLEPRIVEFCVLRATEEELEEIERSFTLLKDKDEEESSYADAAFHLAIARASKNVMFIRLMETMLAMIQETRAKTLSLSRQQEKIWQEHFNIVQSIKNRNAKEAAKAVTLHLYNIRELIEKKEI